MPVLNIEGRRVTVDDSFLSLSPEQQHAAVDEIASSFAKPPDQYQQAALDAEAQRQAEGDTGKGGTVRRFLTKAVVPLPLRMAGEAIDSVTGGKASDLLRRAQQGATFNALDDAAAVLETPAEMYQRGTLNPVEGYNYAKAKEDLELQRARESTGALGTAAELAGGFASGAGLARGGLTTARFLGANPGLVARTLSSAADAAGFGTFGGAMEGNSLGERAANAGTGAAVGGLFGAAVPPALAVAKTAVAPIASNIAARINPQQFAQGQLARGVLESRLTPDEIANGLNTANAEGSPYVLADAMGNSGQRLLSTVARAPGEGRTAVVDALEARQAGQGRRVANALSEGFDSPQTAAQTEARMTAARDAAADAEYGAVRQDAGRVDVVPAINRIDRIIGTQPGQELQAANDSIEAALRPYRERLARVNPDDFEAVQRIRSDMADAAQNARQSGYGNRARLIGQAVRELDSAMEGASEGYRAANARYAQSSRNIEAVQTGRQAATRGRPEDTIPAYEALTPEGQAAHRAGYVDPLIEKAVTSPRGVNKARDFTSDAFAQEAGTMAPGNPLMQRRLSRENTMFETRNTALGGSKTADNLADAEAVGIDPTFIGHVFSGNYTGAAKALIAAGQNAMTGNTPQVREALATILLRRGITGAELENMIGETMRRIQYVRGVVRDLGRGAAGGLADAPAATKKQRRLAKVKING